MAKLYDLMYPAGQYTDKDGQEKTRWVNCGAVIETNNGKRKIKLESIPVEFNGWLECFESKPRQQDGAPQSAPQPASDDFSDEIPF